jgi:hypothetical protein
MKFTVRSDWARNRSVVVLLGTPIKRAGFLAGVNPSPRASRGYNRIAAGPALVTKNAARSAGSGNRDA